MSFFQSQRAKKALITVASLVKNFKSSSTNMTSVTSIIRDQILLGKGDHFINAWIESFAMIGGSTLLTRREFFIYQDWGLTIGLSSLV